MSDDEGSTVAAIAAVLNGQVLSGIGRALDMAIFSFGEDIPWLSAFGDPEVRARFALHVQCHFRVLYRDRVILGHEDIWRLLRGKEKDQFVHDGWHLDEGEEPTVFDAKALSLIPVLAAEKAAVQNMSLSSNGNLELSLSGDLVIRVLPPDPPDGEAWRLFDRQGPHVVFPPTEHSLS